MLILVPTRLEMRRLFPEHGEPRASRRPTAWRRLRSGEAVDVAWCGFGLASAGAGAAALLASRSDDACLVGVAGTLREAEAPCGALVLARHVIVSGLGASGLDAELRADPSLAAPAPPWVPAELEALAITGGMLSVATPSASPGEATARALASPDCLAEEMEAHAVLHAGEALGRRVAILRGISNVAGSRDKATWRLDDALRAVRQALDRWIEAA